MTMTARSAPPMTGEDCANLIGLFNSGWGERRLADHFDIAEEDVRAVLQSVRGRRGLSESEVERRLVVMKPIARAYTVRPVEIGDGQPKFAYHERHVADVMAQGGFTAWSETRTPEGRLRLGLPMLHPIFDGPAPSPPRGHRRRAR